MQALEFVSTSTRSQSRLPFLKDTLSMACTQCGAAAGICDSSQTRSRELINHVSWQFILCNFTELWVRIQI